jgi:PAS domain S-box-containing protein
MTESDVEAPTEVVADLAEKTPIRVLHVDDEAGFLKVAKQCLEMQGSFQVETASSVDEAMEKMKKKTFDVIVSDYKMPEKDGLEFLKELRDKRSKVPFIVFTGKGREEVAVEALNLGADQYLNKAGGPEAVYGELAHSIRKIVKAKQDEERVRESEEKYRRLFENARDVTLTLDLKGKITSINKAAVEYGFKKEDIIGENEIKFVPKKYWPRLLKDLVQIAQGKMVKGGIEIITPKGKKIAEYRSNPIIVGKRVVGVQTILTDITECKAISERYQDLIEKMKDIVYTLDDKGNITFASPATERILGYRPEELIGKNFMAMIPEEWREKTGADFNNLLETGEITAETVLLDRKGQPHFVEYSSTVIEEDDKVVGTRGIVRDISERKKILEELRSSEERLKILFEFAPDAYYLNDLKGTFVDGNKAAEELTGYNKNELVGKSFLKLRLLPRSQIPKAAKLLAKNALGKPTGPDVFTLNRKDGSQVSVEARTFPVKIKGQTLVLGIARDITERKKVEEAIRESEEKFRNIFENASDAMIYLDRSGRILNVNRKAVEVFGGSRDELTGKHFAKIGVFSLREIPKLMTSFANIVAGKEATINLAFKNRKSQMSFLECTGSLMEADGKAVSVMVIARDVTERRKMEEVLRKSEEKYRTLMEETPVGILNLDIKGAVTYVNKTFEEMTGYSRREIVGKDWSRLACEMLHVSDEALKLVAKQMRNRLMGESARPMRVPLRCRDGSLRWVEGDSKAIKKRGIPVGLQAILRDITELVKADRSLKKTMRKLETLNEKLGVVGRLTRHDARNKLSAVTGNIYLAKKKISDHREALQHLEDSESAIRQVEQIFDFASTYEKLGVEELTHMNVEKTVKEAVSLFSDLPGIEVVNDCRGLTLLADSLLRQVFYNLIDNSLKYGEKVTRIRIHYEEGKDQLKLTYEDDGISIPKAEKEKIFKEGYGKGTGYGLYLIRKMCEVYDWSIRETGKQGKGAQFTITIPKMGENGKILYKLQ